MTRIVQVSTTFSIFFLDSIFRLSRSLGYPSLLAHIFLAACLAEERKFMLAALEPFNNKRKGGNQSQIAAQRSIDAVSHKKQLNSRET